MRIIIPCLFLTLAGCTTQPDTNKILMTSEKETSPQYKQGFTDGCKAGLAARDSKPEKAKSQTGNLEYSKAWDEGKDYCQYGRLTY